MNAGFKISFLFVFLISSISRAETNPCFPDIKEQAMKAQQLLNQNQNLLASQQYNLVLALACRDEDKALATLGSAKAFYRLNENLVAERALEELNRFSGVSNVQQKAKLLKAWYEPTFRQNLSGPERQEFENYFQTESEFKNTHQVKKPWLAGTLSAVLPGAGQVYNGNHQSAMMSLVLNSLFLATALEMQREGLPASALAAGLVFSITYTGNIFGSIQSAHQINEKSQAGGIERLRQEMIPEVEL